MRIRKSFLQGNDSIPEPNKNVKLTAGPGQLHDFRSIAQEVWHASQMLHRGDYAKRLIKGINRRIFDILGIPEDLRDREFSTLKDTPEGWHVCYTNSGTDAMQRALSASCLSEGTLVILTDYYSHLVASELSGMGRKYTGMSFRRGEGVVPDSADFHSIAKAVRTNSVSTVFFTENATTTGVDQREVLEELLHVRNESGSSTLFVGDAVSSSILGREQHAVLPDVIFWANQKDPGVGPGSGHVVFNNRVLARAKQIRKRGGDTGGELGLESAYAMNGKRMAKEGQTPHTPPMGELFKELVVLENLFSDGGKERQAVHRVQEEARQLIHKAVDGGALGELGYEMLTGNKGLRSVTTHVLRVPENVTATDIIRGVSSKGYDLSLGYGEKRDEEMRICVYSANTLKQVEEALGLLEQETRRIIE